MKDKEKWEILWNFLQNLINLCWKSLKIHQSFRLQPLTPVNYKLSLLKLLNAFIFSPHPFNWQVWLCGEQHVKPKFKCMRVNVWTSAACAYFHLFLSHISVYTTESWWITPNLGTIAFLLNTVLNTLKPALNFIWFPCSATKINRNFNL